MKTVLFALVAAISMSAAAETTLDVPSCQSENDGTLTCTNSAVTYPNPREGYKEVILDAKIPLESIFSTDSPHKLLHVLFSRQMNWSSCGAPMHEATLHSKQNGMAQFFELEITATYTPTVGWPPEEPKLRSTRVEVNVVTREYFDEGKYVVSMTERQRLFMLTGAVLLPARQKYVFHIPKDIKIRHTVWGPLP